MSPQVVFISSMKLISSSFFLDWGSYFAQQNRFPFRNTPMNPYLLESTLNFTQTQKVLSSARGRKLQQNTLNMLQNVVKKR